MIVLSLTLPVNTSIVRPSGSGAVNFGHQNQSSARTGRAQLFTCSLSNATLLRMVEPLHLNDFTWALTTLLELILLVYLFRRQLYRSHPLFSAYLLATVLESGAVALSYRYWGAQSIEYLDVASGGPSSAREK